MNAKSKYLSRSLAKLFLTPLLALSLLGCSSFGQGIATPGMTPDVAITPTGSIELLPSPIVEPTATILPQEGIAPSAQSSLPLDWVQESYGDAWTIGHPASWTVNAAGAHEGALQLEGEFEGHRYMMTLSYPIGLLPATLEEWVDEMLLPLSLEQRSAVQIYDITVGNTPAKKVLNVVNPEATALSHSVYIWRNETKNPRLITLTQSDGQPVDSIAMERLLDHLLPFIE
jgi:hypothetical protein